MKINQYNANPINPEILDVIIVPALAADKNNNRLGYGKGFYDRFISKYSKIHTITAIPKELLFDKLPVNNFDMKIDTVITD